MALFSDDFLRLRQELDQAHENRRKLIGDIRTNVREMARQNGHELAAQGQQRRAEFTALITDLRGQVRAQADQTRGQLAALAADLRLGGAVFGRKPSSAPRSSRNRQ